jgi:hypothetical protein
MYTVWPALEAAVQQLEAALPTIAAEAFGAFQVSSYEDPEGLQREGSWRAVDVVPLRELVAGPLDGSATVGVGGGGGARTGKSLRCASPEHTPATCTALEAFANQMVATADQGSKRELGPHPWLLEARFHLMTPGTVVMKHTATNNQRLKVHCGIRNPGKVKLQISNWTIPWREGKCIIIDDSFEHQIRFAPGQQARVILQLKVSHPDLNSAPLIMHGVELVQADGAAAPALTRHRELQRQKLQKQKTKTAGEAEGQTVKNKPKEQKAKKEKMNKTTQGKDEW